MNVGHASVISSTITFTQKLQQQLTRSMIRALRLLLGRKALLDALTEYDAPSYDLVCVNLPEVSGGCRCDNYRDKCYPFRLGAESVCTMIGHKDN